MKKIKWIVYIIKDFLGMLSVWQLDHTFSKYVWWLDRTSEIARVFGFKVYMRETDFWVLCSFTLILALFLPELYEISKVINKRINTE